MNDNTQAPAALPFPSDSAEYEEYSRVMNELADIAQDSAPDPEPADFKGICEDAPCCGCCGVDIHSPMDNDNDNYPYGEYDPYEDYNYRDDAPDDSYLDKEDDNTEEEDNGPEDSYLDSYWEDQNEYGMEGCCGDF